MGRTIYLVGPEAVGKSTNAKLLKWFLTRYYNRCVVIPKPEIMSRNLFVDVLARFLMRAGRVEYEIRPEGQPIRKVDTVYMRRIYRLWLFLELLGFLAAYFLKVFPFQVIGCDVILTRFVIDFLTVMYSISRRTRRGYRLPSVFSYVFLRPMFRINSIIYLDAEYSALHERFYKRRSTIIEPPWRIAFVRAVGRRLFQLANGYSDDKLYIDTTNKDLPEVFMEIVRNLGLL